MSSEALKTPYTYLSSNLTIITAKPGPEGESSFACFETEKRKFFIQD